MVKDFLDSLVSAKTKKSCKHGLKVFKKSSHKSAMVSLIVRANNSVTRA
jgi:hypothetical protein